MRVKRIPTGAPAPTYLANTTLETYSQGRTPLASSSCMASHNNATTPLCRYFLGLHLHLGKSSLKKTARLPSRGIERTSMSDVTSAAAHGC